VRFFQPHVPVALLKYFDEQDMFTLQAVVEDKPYAS